jgi:short-subunit dehydrogenase
VFSRLGLRCYAITIERRGLIKELRGRTALVTGASGGIGAYIARRLAREGMTVAVSGRREDALASVVAELRGIGVGAEAVPADLADVNQVPSLIDRVEAVVGPLDVVINNAGLEYTAAFTNYATGELTSMVAVNLTAPLLLTHQVVPGMLARGRGHVVFISSLAGKLGPAYSEPYAATKAGLVGLTQSLRSEYLHAPVGFSVICPGFVAGDGMYQRMVEQGIRSNRLLGATTPEKVADKVVDAIRRNRPEVIESGAPIRPMIALAQLAPRLVERLTPLFGANEVFRRAAAARGRAD